MRSLRFRKRKREVASRRYTSPFVTSIFVYSIVISVTIVLAGALLLILVPAGSQGVCDWAHGKKVSSAFHTVITLSHFKAGWDWHYGVTYRADNSTNGTQYFEWQENDNAVDLYPATAPPHLEVERRNNSYCAVDHPVLLHWYIYAL